MQKLYEAMFIVDSSKAKENYDSLEKLACSVIERYEGKVVKVIKWDDRRLMHEMNGVKRGTYILMHFEAEGDAIAKIERQVVITDELVRVMILVDVDGVETETGSARERAETATTPAATPASSEK